MNDHIDPAIVEVAANALHDHVAERTQDMEADGAEAIDVRRSEAHAALEAAAPLIAAKALRAEADRLEGMAYGRTGRYADAGRHIIARIRDRADDLEAGLP